MNNKSSPNGLFLSIIFHILLVVTLVFLSTNKRSSVVPTDFIEVSLSSGNNFKSSNKVRKSVNKPKKKKPPKVAKVKEVKEEKKKPEVVEKKEEIPEEKKEPKATKEKEKIPEKVVNIEEKKQKKKKVVKKEEKPKKESDLKKETSKEEKKVVKREESQRKGILEELKKRAVIEGIKSKKKVTEVNQNEDYGEANESADSGRASVNPVVLRIYYQAISSKIEKSHQLPPNFKLDGSLQTDVSFRMYESGNTYNVAVYNSSGNEVFDNACIEAVKLASPFPAPPSELKKKIEKEPFIVPCNNEG